MPPINGILETPLYVDDPERSAKFYSDVFGFNKFSSGERLIAMKIADKQILLLFKKGLSEHLPNLKHDGSGQSHMAFAIDAAQLTAWEQWLAQCGVAIEERKQWDRGGVSLYFRDPDGNKLNAFIMG